MKIAFIFFYCILAVNSGCKKQKNETGVPECILYKVINFTKTSQCAEAEVTEYSYQGKLVYVFEDAGCNGAADLSSAVVNSECFTIGHLGGINGNTKINGGDFSTAIRTRTIWQK